MPKVLFKCMIPLSRHSSKKNEKMPAINKRTGRAFVMANQKARYSKNELEQRLILEKLKQRVDTIQCDINAQFIFYFPKTVFFTKENKRSKKLPDLSNLYENPQDCLQEIKILENDTLVVSHDGSRREAIDDFKYWLEIVLTKA